jgi:hypothetical protein
VGRSGAAWVIFFSLCFGEIRGRVAAQVGLEEILSFGQRDVILPLALDMQLSVAA